ncbi:acyltransferase family protein [Murimonas intestini]|uniref:Acyltransferase-like protein n=1 Tax=Murimonas intestini TaxID=1337051 RepID=A0AB73T682_9FIRM|nr:acyltransferase family protein [Murimonas intestini]MCR1839599.1 acyltransferase [Murimonas intestini]MCR1866442.1 acyltransferase [Murimonas intestini]MCR1882440.1 acyltransferase [Murimonas intestini]
MTKGLAILLMVILHLFCRKGADVYGTPLLWVNKTTPLIYYLGFFSEICVPLYSICAGYAQYLLSERRYIERRRNLHRMWRLLCNYWIVLILFCFLGMLLPSDGSMPGSLIKFLKSIMLIHSYNGAWWFLNTYIILIMIPYRVLFCGVDKINSYLGLCFCLILQIICFFADKVAIPFGTNMTQPILAFVWKEMVNLIWLLPYFWAGAFLCKGSIIDKTYLFFEKYIGKYTKLVLCIIFFCLFAGVSAVHKAILMPTVAVIMFLLFNCWKKGNTVEKFFCS